MTTYSHSECNEESQNRCNAKEILRLNHQSDCKMVAFTLAEVLITLGIIGVVAALTLPSVITKYQDKILINQTKKAFAQFQNALALASVENGTPGDNSLTFQKDISREDVVKNIAKYYKGSLVCTGSTQKGCSSYYYKTRNNANTAYRTVDTYPNKIITADGIIFEISSNRTGCENSRYVEYVKDSEGNITYNEDGTPKMVAYYSNICANVRMDVNGVKGPNQYGRDVYHLWIHQNKIDYNTGKNLGGDSLKNVLNGKDELIYTK